MAYFRDIGRGVMTTFYSMGITWKHLFTKSVTLQYPTEKWTLPERSRMRLHNKIEECLGCTQCARACPTQCITVKTEKRGKEEPKVYTPSGQEMKLRTYVYDIDMTLCCYCGICTFQCPTESLIMTPEYEYAAYDKEDLIYRFAVEKSAAEQAAGAENKDPKEKDTVKA